MSRNRLIGLVSIAGILVTTLLLMPMPVEGRVPAAIGNMVHCPLFAVLTIAAIHLADRRTRRSPVQPFVRSDYLIAAMIFGFGVAIEIGQAYSGRTASLEDGVADGVGVLAGYCVIVANRIRQTARQYQRTSRTLWCAAGFLIAIVWWAPVSTLRDVVAIRRDFPLLASFESRTELERWFFKQTSWQLSRRDVTLGDWSVQMTFQVGDYPAATLTDLQHDWSAMKSVEVDVTLDEKHRDPTAEIWFSIVDDVRADDHRDVCRRRFTLRRGQTRRLVITREELLAPDATGRLNLKHIRIVRLQLHEPTNPTTVRVDFLRLKL